MLFIFIAIIIFLLLFLYLTKDYVNPYKLIMVFGKKGSGKTTYLTKIALEHVKRGWDVYSSVPIPFTKPLDYNDIGYFTFPENSVLLIDEVGMIWDNRDFKSFKPEVRDFFKFQRQYKLKVYLFSQTFDIDLKLRNLTDEMYLLTNFCRVFTLCRRINKKITISHADQNGSGVSSLVDDYNFIPIIFGGWKLIFLPRYKEYYNSYDPKYLPMRDGNMYEGNDKQKKYLSEWAWRWHFISQVFLTIVYIPMFLWRKHKHNKQVREDVSNL